MWKNDQLYLGKTLLRNNRQLGQLTKPKILLNRLSGTNTEVGTLGLKTVGAIYRLTTVGTERYVCELIASSTNNSIQRIALLATVFGSSQDAAVMTSRCIFSKQTKHRTYTIDAMSNYFCAAIQTCSIVRDLVEGFVVNALSNIRRPYSYHSSVHDQSPSLVSQ